MDNHHTLLFLFQTNCELRLVLQKKHIEKRAQALAIIFNLLCRTMACYLCDDDILVLVRITNA